MVASHPAVCCRYFNYRVQKFFTCIMLKENSPFGVMVDYFYRVEFQQRGSPHIHGMAWIKNAPQYNVNTDEEVCKCMDQCISCSSRVLSNE